MISSRLYISIFVLVFITSFLIPQNTIFSLCNGKKNHASWIKLLLGCSIPILIYTLFWGLRDEVGTDYLAYVRWFENAEQEILSGGFKEYTFISLCYALSLLSFSYVSIFVVTSFINITSVYISAWKTDKITLALCAYFYFTTSSVFFAQNGLRQAMASSILLIAIHFLTDRKYKYWTIAVILAFFTHQSSIVFASIIWIISLLKPIHSKPLILCVFYWMTEIFGHQLQDLIFGGPLSIMIAKVLGYEEHLSDVIMELGKAATYNSGLGKILRILLNTIVIYVGSHFTIRNDRNFAYYIYWVFIIGIILHQIFAGNLLLQRLSTLFTWVSFPIIAFVGTYLWENRRKIINLILFIFLFLGHFLQYCVVSSIGTNGVELYKMVDL